MAKQQNTQRAKAANRRLRLRRAASAADVLWMGDAEKRALPRARLRMAREQFGIQKAALDAGKLKLCHSSRYKHEIPFKKSPHEIADQWATDTCWIFAFETVLQSKLHNRGVHPRSRLSCNFINFWFLYERAYAVLDLITKQDDPAGYLQRLIDRRGWDVVFDGGGWYHWAAHITQRYGAIPPDRMWIVDEAGTMSEAPDSYDTGAMIHTLREMLAHAALALSDVSPKAQKNRQRIRERFVRRVHEQLTGSLGRYRETFTEERHRYTPKSYLRDGLGLTDDDLFGVTLVHEPRFGADSWNRRIITRDGDFAAIGMPDVTLYNVSLDVMEEATRRTICQKKEAVWCAVNGDFENNPYYIDRATRHRHGARASSVLWPNAFDYALFTGLPRLTRAQRSTFNIGLPSNHAMVLTAYDPALTRREAKYHADNSWSEDWGMEGGMDIYSSGFREFVEAVVVPRDVVPRDVLDEAERNRILRRNPRSL